MIPPSSDFSPYQPATQYEPLPLTRIFSDALTKPSTATYQRIAGDPRATIWRAAGCGRPLPLRR